ncbi:MAG TPA: hypothetical protein DCS67_08165 [Clostridiales bacterium UBA8960]|nr:hypothetical protein [Clostridiales bacterium UBA8960]
MIDFDKAVIAGPFHPAFGELVYANLFLKAMIRCIESMDLHEAGNNLVISVNSRKVSIAIGQKQSNQIELTHLLRKNYPHKTIELKINGNPDIEHNKIRLSMGDQHAMVNIIN